MLSHRILEGLSFNKIKNCYITDLENKLTVTKGGNGDKLGLWDEQVDSTVCKIDKQQGPIE